MARLSKQQLLQRILDALDDGRWTHIIESAAHPFVLRIYRSDEMISVRIYVWNITHGGGAARASDEYRIQVTSGVEKFETLGVDRTLVLGWWEDGEVFAGWDVTKHSGLLGSSPSFQILEGALRDAGSKGMATQSKSNDELAVAFRPNLLGDYVMNQLKIHGLASTSADSRALEGVLANAESPDEAIATASSDARRTVLTTVARKVRDANFADRVLRAYRHSCAMCGVQLRLVEAAHILPVAATSNDSTSNGVALCALHHRAYDRALLTMDSEYHTVYNPEKIKDLEITHRSGGLVQFQKHLNKSITLPLAASDHPSPQLITEANTLRGWQQMIRIR